MTIRPAGVDRMTTLRRQARRILSLPAREIALGLEALLFLAAARILLLLPFARAMRLLGLESSASGPIAMHAKEAGSGILGDIRIGIRRASRFAPFRAVCLPQAVAAGLMLRRRRLASEIHFGVIREADGRMSAHAWTCCVGQVVSGMEGIAGHNPIAIFASGTEMEPSRGSAGPQNNRKVP